MPPERILQIVPAMNCGGMETFIMNVYRHVDRQQVQFDFLTHYAARGFFDDEIEAMGGRIYRLSVREDNNVFKYCRELDDFFAQHPEYKVIHGHYSGFGMFYNHYAKKHGVAVRLGHSHSTGSEKGLVGRLDALMSWFFRFGLTDCLSCGEQAGKALYRSRTFSVYPNGVELAHYAYSPAGRQAARERLGLPQQAVVYGHVGRLAPVKNHAFLLEVFAGLSAAQPEARLLLVGEGPLREALKAQVAALGLVEKVVFAGLQNDTAACYNAMDAFVMPSLYEGFPMVLVEAQANGLLCFVSDTVSAEAALTENFYFLPLQAGAKGWAAQILNTPLQRANTQATLKAAGFDIADTAQRLQALYWEKAKGVAQ